MKHIQCYHCAELIREEATRCTHCHSEITSENRLGLPGWYRNTGSFGFGVQWIEMDLEARAFQGDTENFSILNGQNMMELAYYSTGDEEEYRGFRIYMSFIKERLNEIYQNKIHKIEADILMLLLRYYYDVSRYLKSPSHWCDKNNVTSSAKRVEDYCIDPMLSTLPKRSKTSLSRCFANLHQNYEPGFNAPQEWGACIPATLDPR